jgi:hypothetical protein
VPVLGERLQPLTVAFALMVMVAVAATRRLAAGAPAARRP